MTLAISIALARNSISAFHIFDGFGWFQPLVTSFDVFVYGCLLYKGYGNSMIGGRKSSYTCYGQFGCSLFGGGQ